MLTLSKKIECCVCNKQSVFYSSIGEFRLNQCPVCGIIHLDRVYVIQNEFLSDVKDQEKKLEYWGYPEYFKKYKTIFDYFFEDRYLKIQTGSPSKESWFDFGAGFGLWMNFLRKEKRLHSSGVEIEENAANYSKSLGLDVAHADFKDYQTQKYNVITICDVLEHLENPLEALKKCHDSLNDCGLVYIQVPNVLGLKYPYNDQLGLPHHLWQFDPVSLYNLITAAGFEIVDYWTGVQGVIGHYERGTAHLGRRLLWNLAIKLKRGNRLQMLIRKK